MMHTVFFSLGGNHENSDDLLRIALRRLDKIAEGRVQCSSFYSSPPWGFEADHDFVNCVLRLNTRLKPLDVLKFIQSIEKDLGRIRVGEGYASRPIDIDILYYGDQVINTVKLKLPHPRMLERKFVLIPFYEICSFWIDPITKKSIAVHLNQCKDSSLVSKY